MMKLQPKLSRNRSAHDERDLRQSLQNSRGAIEPAISTFSQTSGAGATSRTAALTSSPSSAIQVPLSQARSSSIYRPLNRSRNEIRLLRTLPPATSQTLSEGLSFASDTIHCQLEYESIDTIKDLNKQKENADAAQNIVLDLLFQGMPEAVSPNNPNMPRIAELLKREYKKKLNASDTLDTMTQYTIDPGRMNLL